MQNLILMSQSIFTERQINPVFNFYLDNIIYKGILVPVNKKYYMVAFPKEVTNKLD